MCKSQKSIKAIHSMYLTCIGIRPCGIQHLDVFWHIVSCLRRKFPNFTKAVATGCLSTQHHLKTSISGHMQYLLCAPRDVVRDQIQLLPDAPRKTVVSDGAWTTKPDCVMQTVTNNWALITPCWFTPSTETASTTASTGWTTATTNCRPTSTTSMVWTSTHWRITTRHLVWSFAAHITTSLQR